MILITSTALFGRWQSSSSKQSQITCVPEEESMSKHQCCTHIEAVVFQMSERRCAMTPALYKEMSTWITLSLSAFLGVFCCLVFFT